MVNYDPSKVGVPYIRVHQLTIDWRDMAALVKPTAVFKQQLAVTLADGSMRVLESLPDVSTELDFSAGDDPIPLVDPETAQPLGMNTTLNQVMLGVLAIIRKTQIESNEDNLLA